MKNKTLTIIAGPCSIDEQNKDQLLEIADITITENATKQYAIAGTRIVGLKSRTEYNPTGSGMGIDYSSYERNLQKLVQGATIHDLETSPSAQIAIDIYTKTNMLIATEVMNPLLQLSSLDGKIPAGKLMPWNPSVQQLGWVVFETAQLCKKNDWHIGIKNGKWLGEDLSIVTSPKYAKETSLSKTWKGLHSYTDGMSGQTIFIHRGVDVPGKNDYRNAPVHNIAMQMKKTTGAQVYYDPSHAHGPKMRHSIPEETIAAMKLKTDETTYLYDGILIEVGTSSTDTEQHISIEELQIMVDELATFRDLKSR